MKKCLALRCVGVPAILIVVIALALFGCSKQSTAPAKAASTQPITIKLGHCTPTDNQLHITSEIIANHVKERSGGTITVQIYPNNQLGGERAMFDQVLAGTLDMTPTSVNIQATAYPEFYVFSLPFIFPNEDVFYDVVNDPEVSSRLVEIVKKKTGAHLLGFLSCSFRGGQNTKRPIRGPADFVGLKYRVMEGEIYTDIFTALGATTSTMPMPEVYTALQQKLVDGEDCNIQLANSAKLTEVEKYATELNAMMSTNPMVIAEATWKKLTPEQQQWFVEGGNKAKEWSVANSIKMTDAAYQKATTELGVKVIRNSDLTPVERAAFVAAVQPIWKKYKNTIGPEFFDWFTGKVDAAKKKRGV